MSLCIDPFIQALPEQSASLLLAVDIKGQSQKALAEEQNVSYSIIKSRVQKSRGDLKNLFEQCYNLPLDKQGNAIDCELQPVSGCGNC